MLLPRPFFTGGRTVLELGGHRHDYRFVPRLHPVQLADAGQALFRLDRMARRVPAQAPWQAPGAATTDARTLADWARRNVRTRLGRFAIEAFSQGVLACEPGEVSLLHTLFYLRTAGGFRQLTEVAGTAQQDRFAGGSQLIALRMAEQLGPDHLWLGAPVTRIEQGSSRVAVHSPAGAVTGRRAVVAVPPALAGRLRRARLDRRPVDPRLLWRALPARHLDPVRAGAAPPGLPAALGGHRDRDPVERIHGRRGPVRPARGRRDHGHAAATVSVTGLVSPDSSQK